MLILTICEMSLSEIIFGEHWYRCRLYVEKAGFGGDLSGTLAVLYENRLCSGRSVLSVALSCLWRRSVADVVFSVASLCR